MEEDETVIAEGERERKCPEGGEMWDLNCFSFFPFHFFIVFDF